MTMTKKQLKAIRRSKDIRRRRNVKHNATRGQGGLAQLLLVNSKPTSGYRLWNI